MGFEPTASLNALPGADLIETGIADLARGTRSILAQRREVQILVPSPFAEHRPGLAIAHEQLLWPRKAKKIPSSWLGWSRQTGVGGSGVVRYARLMATRAGDWFRQAEADLAHARHALAGGHHEWACFAAQQAAEKAAKAAHQSLGQEGWGPSVTELLEALQPQVPSIDEALLDRARALDKLYVPTRYPNGLPTGAPADYYTRAEAERAIGDAEGCNQKCESGYAAC